MITSLALKDVHFDYIYSSPLKRAYKTAQIICDNEIKLYILGRKYGIEVKTNTKIGENV